MVEVNYRDRESGNLVMDQYNQDIENADGYTCVRQPPDIHYHYSILYN